MNHHPGQGKSDGTGVFVPAGLWQRAKTLARRHAGTIVRDGGQIVIPEVFDIRLRSGRVITQVVISWDGQLLHRCTGLRGPEWTTEGLDCQSDDIAAIGVVTRQFLGLWTRIKWFSR